MPKCKYAKNTNNKNDLTQYIYAEINARKHNFEHRTLCCVSTTMCGLISHASLFFTGLLQNLWQTLAEPLGCAEPRLKITAIDTSIIGAGYRNG